MNDEREIKTLDEWLNIKRINIQACVLESKLKLEMTEREFKVWINTPLSDEEVKFWRENEKSDEID
jgi:hypothetical protein